jgi:hypothetical protein
VKIVVLLVATVLTMSAGFPYPEVREVPTLPFHATSMTLYPFILVTAATSHEPDYDCLIEHETYHWQEIGRHGAIAWYTSYYALLLKYPSSTHPMEVPALRIGSNCSERGRQ